MVLAPAVRRLEPLTSARGSARLKLSSPAGLAQKSAPKKAAASLLDGLQVRDFTAALLGSLIYSVLGVVIESALDRLFPKQ